MSIRRREFLRFGNCRRTACLSAWCQRREGASRVVIVGAGYGGAAVRALSEALGATRRYHLDRAEPAFRFLSMSNTVIARVEQ